jgi:hypothetical protein
VPGSLDIINYLDPAISLITVNRPVLVADLTFAQASFPAAFARGDVRMLRIYGANFGPGTFGTAPALLKELEVQRTAGGPWESPDPELAFQLSSWTDSLIVAFTTIVPGTLRVAVSSAAWGGTASRVVSAGVGYFDYNPQVVVTNSGPYPCNGFTAAGVPAGGRMKIPSFSMGAFV